MRCTSQWVESPITGWMYCAAKYVSILVTFSLFFPIASMFLLAEPSLSDNVIIIIIVVVVVIIIIRVATVLENPGKSWNWQKNF